MTEPPGVGPVMRTQPGQGRRGGAPACGRAVVVACERAVVQRRVGTVGIGFTLSTTTSFRLL
jgi:hypothetical protein